MLETTPYHHQEWLPALLTPSPSLHSAFAPAHSLCVSSCFRVPSDLMLSWLAAGWFLGPPTPAFPSLPLSAQPPFPCTFLLTGLSIPPLPLLSFAFYASSLCPSIQEQHQEAPADGVQAPPLTEEAPGAEVAPCSWSLHKISPAVPLFDLALCSNSPVWSRKDSHQGRERAELRPHAQTRVVEAGEQAPDRIPGQPSFLCSPSPGPRPNCLVACPSPAPSV